MAMSKAAAEARREYARAWREANRDKVRAYQKAWREANRDKAKEQVVQYWERRAAEEQSKGE